MFGTYLRLRVSVWASDRVVIAAARSNLRRGALARKHRQFRHDYYRAMLDFHRKAQDLHIALIVGA